MSELEASVTSLSDLPDDPSGWPSPSHTAVCLPSRPSPISAGRVETVIWNFMLVLYTKEFSDFPKSVLIIIDVTAKYSLFICVCVSVSE